MDIGGGAGPYRRSSARPCTWSRIITLRESSRKRTAARGDSHRQASSGSRAVDKALPKITGAKRFVS